MKDRNKILLQHWHQKKRVLSWNSRVKSIQYLSRETVFTVKLISQFHPQAWGTFTESKGSEFRTLEFHLSFLGPIRYSAPICGEKQATSIRNMANKNVRV